MSAKGHGTLTGCGCFTCRVKKSEWEKRRAKAAQAGRPYSTTGHVTARRVSRFLDAGFTYTAIGRPLNMDGRVLQRIVEDPQGKVLRSTERRVLDLRPSQIAPGRVSAAGAMRRIRDLSVQGWRLQMIAEHAHVHENTVRSVALRKLVVINSTTDSAVKKSYEEMAKLTAPTDPMSLSWARKAVRRGWRRLAAYDEPDRAKLYKWETK